jgi:hypothetical protein
MTQNVLILFFVGFDRSTRGKEKFRRIVFKIKKVYMYIRTDNFWGFPCSHIRFDHVPLFPKLTCSLSPPAYMHILFLPQLACMSPCFLWFFRLCSSCKICFVKFVPLLSKNPWRPSLLLSFQTMFIFLLINSVKLVFSSSAMDDLQMKELQDQLEAEQYFSVSVCCINCNHNSLLRGWLHGEFSARLNELKLHHDYMSSLSPGWVEFSQGYIYSQHGLKCQPGLK